ATSSDGRLEYRAFDAERQRLHRHVLRPRVALHAHHGDDLVDFVGLDAGEYRGVALVQEAARAADLRRRVALLDELLRELLGVRVGGDDDDELELSVFLAAPSNMKPPAASSESYAPSIQPLNR